MTNESVEVKISRDPNYQEDILDQQAFYEAMQRYRHMPLHEQTKSVEAFEAIKRFIRENHGQILARMRQPLKPLPNELRGMTSMHPKYEEYYGKIGEPLRPWKCSTCEEEFEDEKQLREHFESKLFSKQAIDEMIDEACPYCGGSERERLHGNHSQHCRGSRD
jgi:hypothetical protein